MPHPFPPPIALGCLAGDLAAVSTRHRAVDRPPKAPSGRIEPTPEIPYPRSCLATTPPSQNWAPGGEPPRDFTGGRTPAGSLPPSPFHAVSPPSSGMWAHAMAPSSRHPHAVTPLVGRVGCLPTRPRARSRSAGPKTPPAQLAEKPFFFFLFPISFSYFHIYIYLYADILCTKNSLNKF
jgi:hypothetical protein